MPAARHIALFALECKGNNAINKAAQSVTCFLFIVAKSSRLFCDLVML